LTDRALGLVVLAAKQSAYELATCRHANDDPVSSKEREKTEDHKETETVF